MEDEAKAINYRLSNIEKTLAELKDVVIETKLQQKDIDDLKNKKDEILRAVNAHDQRLRVLENRPSVEKANRWTTVTDTVFKLVLTALVSYVLIKVGLPS